MDARTKAMIEAKSYRTPMRVSAIRAYRTIDGYDIFPICPRCGISLEREYQSYCDRCGQALGWQGFSKAVIVFTR